MRGHVDVRLTAKVTITIEVKELTSGHAVLIVDGENVVVSEGEIIKHTGTVNRDWSA
jgi:hypothetical protein